MRKTNFKNLSFCCYGFMREELGLSGTELLLYALIHSFTKGKDGLCYSSRAKLADIVGVSERTVFRMINSLKEKGCIEIFSEDGVKGIRALRTEPEKENSVKVNSEKSRDESRAARSIAQRLVPPPHELDDTDESIFDYLCDESDYDYKRPKYEFYSARSDSLVYMTPEQYSILLDLVGADVLGIYIRKLDKLKEDKGYQTFNPYKTIRKWILEDVAT